jgi:UDP-N-acetylmuramoyl-L-alanyl-D-glutamate--2,6-diaminopimelate ligase
MKLLSLLKNIHFQKIIGKGNPEIKGIAYHSDDVKDGYLFVAIKGQITDGHFFVDKAIKNGARAIILERPLKTPLKIVQVLVKDSKTALSEVSQVFYHFPNKKIKIIGITGTQGKTSTSFFVKSVLEESNRKSGLIGTIYYKSGKKILKMAQRTTPMSLDILKFFDRFQKEGIRYVVMEVSSQALDLKRVYGFDFEVACFTGISHEHLDWHKNIKNYLNSKLKIIKENKTKFLVVNLDDPFSRYFLKNFPKKRTITYGIKNQKADFFGYEIKSDLKGTCFKLRYKKNELPVKLKVIGDFQVLNALAAFAICSSLKIPLKTIKRGVEKLKRVPGRFEVIKAKDFNVVIDYAHTPESLKTLLLNAKKLVSGRIILIFGCGGTRDKSKRAPMGEISGKLADFTIITSDNPRFEEPEEIIKQIEKGIKKTKGKYIKIVDRKEAIKRGLKMAKKGDLVLIAGKGHETYQIFKDKTIPFSDKKVVQEIIRD